MSLLVWGATLISGFIIVFALMPSLIRYFRARKEGQMIREEGPKWHEKKSGTPTVHYRNLSHHVMGRWVATSATTNHLDFDVYPGLIRCTWFLG